MNPSFLLLGALVSAHAAVPAKPAVSYANEYCRLIAPKADITIQRAVEEREGFIPAFDGNVHYSNVEARRQIFEPRGQNDLELKVLEESARTTRRYDDGCWQGQTGSFTRTIRVEKISTRAEGRLGIRDGLATQLACKYENIAPVGKTCPK